MMFEPLNSTSEPLTAFEVFRSKVVRQYKDLPDFPKTHDLLDYDNSKRDDVTKRSNLLTFSTAQVVSGKYPPIHFVKLKNYLDTYVREDFVSYLEKNAEFLQRVWYKQTLNEKWFDDETKNCVRFLKAARHEASMPILMRYYQTDPKQIPEVIKAIVAFFALWRPVFPTNKLPQVYRDLLTEKKPNNMALEGGTLKTTADLKVYFKGKIEELLGTPPEGKTYEDIWSEEGRQIYLKYEQLDTLCRLFIFLNIGDSIKSDLVPDDP